METLINSGFFEDVDWDEIYSFAKKQTLLGVFANGVGKLTNGPTEDQVMDWMGDRIKIKRKNKQLNEACVRLYNKVKDWGFDCCILKGQGNALLYPNHDIRTPGDIDLWINGARDEIKSLAFQIAGKKGSLGDESYNHIELKIGDVSVELHYTPVFMNSQTHNKKLQVWLRRESATQFKNDVLLPDTTATVCVPTISFNLVYQLVHLFHHVFYEGVGLRQIIDYYYVIQNASNKDFAKARKDIKQLSLWHFAGAVMYVLKQVLHLQEDKMIASIDKIRGKLLLSDILQGGNFGKYGYKDNENKQGIQHNLLRIKRDMHLVRYYPSEALGEPCFRLWHYVWRKQHK